MKKGKRIIVSLMLTAVLCALLTACGEKKSPAEETVESTAVAETVENVETVAEEGELEAEKQAYFIEHPITVTEGKEFSLPFAVSTCEPEEQTRLEYKGVLAEPVDNQKIVIDNVTVTDDEDDKYSDIQIDMTITDVFRLTLDYYDYEEVEYFVNCQANLFKLIDFYTGQNMPYLTYDSKAPGYDFTKVINWGGKNYNVSYSVIKNTSSEQGDWQADEEDTEARYEYYDTTVTHNVSVYIKMPKEYDGLMLYAKKNNVEFDDETYYENKTEDSVVFFDTNKTEDPADYLFVKVADLIK